MMRLAIAMVFAIFVVSCTARDPKQTGRTWEIDACKKIVVYNNGYFVNDVYESEVKQ